MQITPLSIYNPKRTFLVTAHTENNTYLVRGNEPLNEDGTFAYDAINNKLKTLISDFDLTKNKLITITIIDNNPAGERTDWALEFNSYGIINEELDKMFPFPDSWPPVYRKLDVEKQYGNSINGNKGSIVWYPVQGCSDESNCEMIEPSQFNFSGLVDYIQKLMTTESNAVIYYHCEHGHDRTSALTGGYMLKYMNIDLQSVLTEKPPLGAKAFKHDWEVDYEQLVKYYSSTLK